MAIKKRQQLDESESEQEEEHSYTYANDSQDEDVIFMYSCLIGSLANYFFRLGRRIRAKRRWARRGIR